MIKKVIYILILLNSSSVWCQKIIIGSKSLPKEFNLLLGNYHLYSPETVEKIKPQLYSIDYSARSFSQEDLLLLIKIEIYKTFLKNYDSPVKTPVDGKTIEIISSALKKTNDNFMRWFLEALLKDSQELISNPSYKEFLLQKNVNVKVEKVEYRKVEKKAELLQFWISKLNPDSEEFPENFRQQLAIKMQESITNIQNSLQFMSRESAVKSKEAFPKNDMELKFFSFQDYVAPKSKPEAKNIEVKSVEDILAPLVSEPVDENSGKLPTPVKEDWTADPNLPKPTNDAQWLEDF